jgi:hypothetical protein
MTRLPQMTKCLMTLLRRALAPALLLAMATAGHTGGVAAQDRQRPDRACWQRPGLETLEETLLLTGRNGRARQAKLETLAPSQAVLLISNGFNNVAYSAGLIVGWGETGERPRFAAITAVGASALIARTRAVRLELRKWCVPIPRTHTTGGVRQASGAPG